ncbi:hypothetical protein HL658_12655 [Azospirillum sp. RWY-5-1]|uniref:Uncharacterized protein n=1 Tax=Azospirillum oleiclasticum TaxID=2735135 RepID=A0ABX2T8A4_9PROT|nr:hypothetical protein [Azospirillum oleiclasticum]NYZ13403.1 hypothetical protein [Azospirillum oleiclasticum]NYZ20564.1 hypothetical protein [Azospirillum oleiclasticum]
MAFLTVDDAEPEKVPTAEEARAEIEDWKRRIAELFAMIRSVAAGLGGWTADDSRTSVISERIMQLRGIPAYPLSILELHGPGKATVKFIPDARWVSGTRGRVMILGTRRPARLLDLSEGPGTADWRLFDPMTWQDGGVALTAGAIAALIGEAR